MVFILRKNSASQRSVYCFCHPSIFFQQASSKKRERKSLYWLCKRRDIALKHKSHCKGYRSFLIWHRMQWEKVTFELGTKVNSYPRLSLLRIPNPKKVWVLFMFSALLCEMKQWRSMHVPWVFARGQMMKHALWHANLDSFVLALQHCMQVCKGQHFRCDVMHICHFKEMCPCVCIVKSLSENTNCSHFVIWNLFLNCLKTLLCSFIYCWT